MYQRPSEKRREKDLLIPKGIFPPSPCWKLPCGSRRWVNSDVWSTVMEMPRIKKLLDAHANLTADRWDMDMDMAWVDVHIDMGWRHWMAMIKPKDLVGFLPSLPSGKDTLSPIIMEVDYPKWKETNIWRDLFSTPMIMGGRVGDINRRFARPSFQCWKIATLFPSFSHPKPRWWFQKYLDPYLWRWCNRVR